MSQEKTTKSSFALNPATTTSSYQGWLKFRIALAVGPGEHSVQVAWPGLPVLLDVYGLNYDEQDRPSAVIEAYHPDIDGIGWNDIWEAVRHQYPNTSPQRQATQKEYQAIKDSIATFGPLQRVIVDEHGSVIAGRLRKRACTELGVNCPTEVVAGLTADQKAQLAFDLDFCRKHLSLADKRKAAEFLLKCNPRNTDRLIGRASGLDHKTVGGIRANLETAGEIPQVAQRQGGDGKTYKFTKIVADSPKELDTALRAIKNLPANSAGKILDPITAKRRAKRNIVKQDRDGRVFQQDSDESIRLLHCRFQELQNHAGLAPGSSTLILTDIPYDGGFLRELPELAQLAMNLLVEGGLFVTYAGMAYLPKVMRILEANGLTYQWVLSSVWEGRANVVHHRNVLSKWLPILVFSKGEWKDRGQWVDVLSYPTQKDWHPWQRPLGEVEALVRFFSNPGDLVIDPCGGGFTTAAACLRQNRRCVSCDDKLDNYQNGLERLFQEREARNRPK